MIQPLSPLSAENEIALQIPSDAEYVRVVRLAVIGVASRMAFSYDDIEDIKLAVSEACNNAILHAQVPTERGEQKATTEAFLAADAESLTQAAVSLSRQEHGTGASAHKPPIVVRLSPHSDRLEISVEDGGQVALPPLDKPPARKPFETPHQAELPEGGMGLFLIESLMDEVRHQSGANSNTVIHMTKYLPQPATNKAVTDNVVTDKAVTSEAATHSAASGAASSAAVPIPTVPDVLGSDAPETDIQKTASSASPSASPLSASGVASQRPSS
jgi:serine/threonine-protein kinase RsbW